MINKIPFNADDWPGKWIWTSGTGRAFEVVQFTRHIPVSHQAQTLKFHITADNRYKLYLDGRFVGLGPQRGDLLNWYFDSYEFNKSQPDSEHVLTAIVWHDRDRAPFAQISSRPAFLLAAEEPFGDLSTDLNWKCRSLTENYTIDVPEELYCAGTGFDSTGIAVSDFCPSKEMLEKEFQTPILVGLGMPARDHRARQSDVEWRLKPRDIPELESDIKTLGKCRRVEVLSSSDSQFTIKSNDIDSFISNCKDEVPQHSEKKIVIPPETHFKFLLDNTVLTAGYPVMIVSNGKGANVTMAYQEALQSCSNDILSKGNRDEIKDKTIVGLIDRFHPDRSRQVLFEPFWFRCWRYIEFDIKTLDEPLEISYLSYRTTGYPFELKADIQADNWFSRLVEPGFRTMRLCAGETYYDCPYYEQIQYLGDTRIQALLSYLLCGDDRLARAAIDAFDRSRISSGFTRGSYPNRNTTILPVFSLIYIAMLNDFLMWQGDREFVHKYMSGVEAVLHGFEKFIEPDGLIGKIPGWPFVDWAVSKDWNAGMPPGAEAGTSFLINFFHLYALQQAALLYKFLQDKSRQNEFEDKSESLQSKLKSRAFDASKQLFTDDFTGKHFSQHTNILAILTKTHEGIIDGQRLLINMMQQGKIAETTQYFSFYLFEAMYQVGRADLIWPALKPWHDMLDKGLTTFTETPEPTRSDCHAWSCHPLFHYFASVLGVRPLSPRSDEMLIKPAAIYENDFKLPELLGGSFMTPHGLCKIKMSSKAGNWQIETEFPDSIILHGLN